jgi:DNA replication initiation complex subunit (GINS family)
MSDRYERLHGAWVKERDTEELQNINDEFIRDMKQYAQELNRAPVDADTLPGRITLNERLHVNQMLKELTEVRLSKIVRRELEAKPIDAQALTPEEQRLHSNLRNLLASYRDGSELPVSQAEPPTRAPTVPRQRPEAPQPPPKTQEPDLVVVRFLQQLPAIMGVDMKAYGPFKPEDVASIPRQNAVNLIRRGIAKLVEIEP